MKNQEGFGIIEILISIAILSIGILAVAKMQLGAIEGNTHANFITKAVNLAQDKAEFLVSLPYNDTLLDDTDSDGTNQDTNGDGKDDVGTDLNFGLNDTGNLADHSEIRGNYNIFWNIAVNYPINGTKTINVIVQWTVGNVTQQINVSTMKTNI